MRPSPRGGRANRRALTAQARTNPPRTNLYATSYKAASNRNNTVCGSHVPYVNEREFNIA